MPLVSSIHQSRKDLKLAENSYILDMPTNLSSNLSEKMGIHIKLGGLRAALELGLWRGVSGTAKEHHLILTFIKE